MGIYSISGSPIRISFKKTNDKFDVFKSNEDDFCAEITVGDFGSVGSGSFGVEYLSKDFAHFMRSKSNPSAVLFSNFDWTESFICSGSGGETSDELMIAAVYSVLSRRKTLFLHSATVDYNGSGIVFVGPSGIGKTTQAELWHEYLNADIINGDKIFVRENEKEFMAYASPWKGSSPYCINRNVPVKAVVALRQSSENRIRAINSDEILEYIVPHIFLPFWDEKCMDFSLETLDAFLTKVPFFLLECRADREAVEITKNLVMGE